MGVGNLFFIAQGCLGCSFKGLYVGVGNLCFVMAQGCLVASRDEDGVQTFAYSRFNMIRRLAGCRPPEIIQGLG